MRVHLFSRTWTHRGKIGSRQRRTFATSTTGWTATSRSANGIQKTTSESPSTTSHSERCRTTTLRRSTSGKCTPTSNVEQRNFCWSRWILTLILIFSVPATVLFPMVRYSNVVRLFLTTHSTLLIHYIFDYTLYCLSGTGGFYKNITFDTF